MYELLYASHHLVRLIPWPSILLAVGEAPLGMDTAGLYARSWARWAVKGPEQTRGEVRVHELLYAPHHLVRLIP